MKPARTGSVLVAEVAHLGTGLIEPGYSPLRCLSAVGEVADLAGGLTEPGYSPLRYFSAVGEVVDLAYGLIEPGYSAFRPTGFQKSARFG